jgi:hypothetical protein
MRTHGTALPHCRALIRMRRCVCVCECLLQKGVKNGVPKNPQTIEEWFEYSEALKAERRPPRTGSPTPNVDLSILRGVGTVAPTCTTAAPVDPDSRFESYGGYGGAKPGSRTSVSHGGE